MTSLHKLKPREKKVLFPICLEAKELIGKFDETLASAMSSTLSNEKIAQLNSLAYKGITKRGLQRQLDKRVQANAEHFDTLDDKIEAAVKNINFEELQSRFKTSVDELGQCVLSCNNWIEALKDGDCLCIGIDVTRSQAAIADPSQVVVKKIASSFLSAESFLDSVLYASAKDSSHGGFDRNAQGCILVGQSREPITGVLPLYLSLIHI
eukprot:TRINITY_DN4622_c0_g1_i1.p1 TRINITY_DN4622_c0_g1~~TRINITY_DN4622_c0_g1_i1.p1  ORF type:complete len:209 (+),score=43.92 TRINITY_DN4622_c0_g1_i1:107-733(+)